MKDRPVSGETAAYTYMNWYRVRIRTVPFTPFRHQHRPTTGMSPNRPSSKNRISRWSCSPYSSARSAVFFKANLGFDIRTCMLRAWHFDAESFLMQENPEGCDSHVHSPSERNLLLQQFQRPPHLLPADISSRLHPRTYLLPLIAREFCGIVSFGTIFKRPRSSIPILPDPAPNCGRMHSEHSRHYRNRVRVIPFFS